jgi:chaperone modulatory protein CbpM
MASRFAVPQLLAEHVEVALEELVEASGLTLDEIVALVEYGVFEPRGAAREEWTFSASCIALGRRARRLKSAFELDVPGLALALTCLERIDELESELTRLRCVLLRDV